MFSFVGFNANFLYSCKITFKNFTIPKAQLNPLEGVVMMTVLLLAHFTVSKDVFGMPSA